VVATDSYLQVAEADPDLKKPANERRFSAGPSQLALIAAEVEYAFDDIEEARKRFETILSRWPGEAEILDNAVPLYLQTFLVTQDDAGYAAGLARVKDVVNAEEAKATDPKQKQVYAKVRDQLARYEQGAGYAAASRLLEQGKSAEAAALFEKFAQEYKDSPDAPNALYNASVAWDKANEPEKASAAREQIVTRYAESKTAPLAQLMLAGARSKKGNHAEAAKLYGEYLSRWPEGQNRCVALQNVGYELDVQDKRADAAERYLAFGADPKCAKDDPNAAAKALYRAGVLFQKAKQKPRAKQAFTAATRVEGVTDTVAKSQLDDAKKQLKGL
jgi:outer membrane protein assembly factor BamD (BamD/ComL family)